FCENHLDYQKIKKKIDNYNSNELQTVITFLDKYKKDLSEYIMSVNSFLEKKNHVLTVLSNPKTEEYYERMESLNNDLIKITDFIELKISQMSESVDIEEDKFKELESIIKNIESYVANIKRILTTEQDE